MLGLTGRDRGLKESFRNIAVDLMHLEVNTIIKTSLLTAQKAPRPAHTLLDIAGEYRDRLLENGYGLKSHVAEKAEEENQRMWREEAGEMGVAQVDSQTFRNLYVTARFGLDSMELVATGGADHDPDREMKKAVLSRIRKSSSEIADILDRLDRRSKGIERLRGWAFQKTRRQILEYGVQNPDDRTPDLILTNQEWIKIRKIWEVSVEEIAMQTVIQLDGDVVTRIGRPYARDKHHHLWHAHMESTKVAMDSWQYLVETIGKFVKNAIVLFRGK